MSNGIGWSQCVADAAADIRLRLSQSPARLSDTSLNLGWFSTPGCTKQFWKTKRRAWKKERRAEEFDISV